MALAGEPGTLDNDNVILQVGVSPAQAGTSRFAQPVAVDFSSRAYTANGQRSARTTRFITLRFAGFRFNPQIVPKCLESVLEAKGPSGCPPGSRLGRGTATADARPTAPTPIAAKVQAFNGTLDVGPDGKPVPLKAAILIYAEAPGGLKTTLPTLFRGSGSLQTAPGTPPAPGQQPLFSITSLHLVLPVKTARRAGRTVGFVEAPRSCRRFYSYTQTNTYYSGERLVARDTQPCLR